MAGLVEWMALDVDENRKVLGIIPPDGGVQFQFWNGAAKTEIRLSDEAFQAAMRVYVALQKKQIELEAHSAQGKHPAIGCSEKEINVSYKEIETMIQEKRLTAPRVTPARIQEVIAKAEYFRITGTLTVCVLTLKNGFTVAGESACASPEYFNEEIGNKIARENAEGKVWALEGYLLREELSKAEA